MHFLIPEQIETERLLLRRFEESDWKNLHELYSNPECIKYTVLTPFTEYETWQKVASFTGHWLFRKYGPYAIEEKHSEKTIGFTGPYFPPFWPDPEIQWSLSQPFWGKGFAGEAVRAVKKMLTTSMPDTSFISIIHPKNSASIALAGKMNADFEKEFLFKNIAWHVYRHL
jgi:RimJ/RimL family protein N-acetyltransferase